MIGTRRTIGFVLFLAACQSSAPQPQPVARSERSAPTSSSCKPEAPLAIEIATRPIGNGELEVIARATPTSAVASIELALVVPAHANALAATTARFEATASGMERTLTTRIRVDNRTSSITAIARVPVDDIEMSRAATVAIGVAEPPPRTKAYALPDGEMAREVRP